VSGAVVFKNARRAVEIISGSVDAFVEIDGLTRGEAISETMHCHSSVPGSADNIRRVLAFRDDYD